MINFICFIGEVNFTLQTGPALFKFTRTRLLYNFAGKSYLISRLVVIWLSYNHPEYNKKSANLQHCQQPCYSYLWATVDIVGCFYGNE